MFAVSVDNSTCVNQTLQWRWLETQKFSNASVIDLQKKETARASMRKMVKHLLKKYKCANVKRRKGCNKKTVQKDWLEDLVVRETMKLIQDDAVIDKIVQLVMDVQNQENTTIPLLEKQLREVNKKLDNLMKAIEDGLYTRTTKERLEALEIQKDELTEKIADEKLKKPSFNEDFIRFWLLKFRKFDISQKKQRKALIEIFVNAIFLYDDRMLITFNYKDGTQTVRFEDTLTADSAEEKSSDLSSLAGPFRTNDFMLEIVGSFLFYPRVSLGLDHNSDHKGGKAACSCPERMEMQNRSPCQARCSGRGCGFQVWEGSGLSPGGSACSAA